MSAFTILIEDTQATPFTWSIGKQVVRLRFSSSLPGGCLDASFRVYAPTFLRPPYLDIFHSIKIRDNRGVTWAGRIEDLESGQDSGGEYWEVGCVGWGVHLDDQIDTAEDVRNQLTSTVVTNALTNFTQKIDIFTVGGTSFTLSNSAAINAKMLTAAQLIGWALDFGNSTNQHQHWHVYPRDNGDIEFTSESRPATATLFARVAGFESKRFGLTARRLANRVIVQYNNNASTVTVNNTTLQGAGPAGWGVIKAVKLSYPELSDAADATQLATTALAVASAKRMAAKSLVARSNVRFRNEYGQRIPLHRVRAGMLLEFTDRTGFQTGGSSGLVFDRSCHLAGTEYDEDTQTLTLTPESHELSVEEQVARIYQVLDGQHTVRGAL